MIGYPNCIITGVVLCDTVEHRCKAADLFIFGDRYIVNASGNGELRTPFTQENVLFFDSDLTPHFERRNVYIFPADKSLLNAAAQAYIARSPHAS